MSHRFLYLQPEHKSIKPKAANQSKAEQHIVSSETMKEKSVTQQKKSTKSKNSTPESKIESSPVPLSESSVEIMRCKYFVFNKCY